MRISRFALAVALLAAPVLTSARVVDLHPDAIGVTEADFQTLKTSHCYFNEEDAPATAVRSEVTGAICDPLLARLDGQIIFRAQHAGEQYQIHTGDGLSGVTRYLPDGFYKANGTIYWVANGYRTRLTEGDAYRRILLTAQRTPSMVTYVNSSSIMTDQQQRNLHGRIVIMVDQNHSLAYVPDPIYGDLRTLSQKNSAELEEIIGDEMIHVTAKLIKKLPVNNDWK